MSFELHKGNRSPSLGETIRIQGEPFDLAGCTAKLKMRPELAATPLKVDATATIVTASTTLTGQHLLPALTLTVASTAGFLDEGALVLGGQIVFYTGKTATTFLGCTRGSGTIAGATSVAQIGGVRYDWAAADVDTGGNFRAWFEITLPGGVKTQDTPELDVTILEHAPVTRPLCALVDVLRYVPGYESEPVSDELLETFIASTSRSIHQTTDREFVAIVGAGTRIFPLGPRHLRTRRVRVGDCTTVSTVRILDEDALTLVSTVASSARQNLPTTRQEWEPITQIRLLPTTFGGPQLELGHFLEVAGTWGFPQIPEDVRQACAQRVIVRYMGDVAARGTAFADAVAESEISIGGLLASSREALAGYSAPSFT